MNRRKLIFINIFLLLIGCAQPSVLHLKKNEWVNKKDQRLEMKYLEFNYQCEQVKDSFLVKGTAYLRRDKVPSWGHFAEEIWLGAYLSDKRGKVLAKEIKLLPPQPITDHGFPFNFLLKPSDFGSPGPIYITFGYRLKISNIYPQSIPQKPKIFFAIEKAEAPGDTN